MLNKVLNKIIIITTIALLICIFISYMAFTFISNGQASDELESYCEYFENSAADITSLDVLEVFLAAQYSEKYKITIISDQGQVLYDKNPNDLENINFIDEDFFKQVLNNQKVFKAGTPYVDGVSMMSLYKRIQLTKLEGYDGLIIRYSTYIIYNNEPFWILIGIGVAVWLVIVIGTYFIFNGALKSSRKPLLSIKRRLEDIEHGNYNTLIMPNIKMDDPEFKQMYQSINEISQNISQMLNNLTIEQRKTDFLLESMNQGLIVVSAEGKILTTNAVVNQIFKNDSSIAGVSLDYLIKDEVILERLYYALDTKSYVVFNAEIKQSTYRIETMFSKYAWFENTEEMLLQVLLTDITQENKSAEIRSEFFTNASHELKTPLTAIRGYSEMLTLTSDQSKIAKCGKEINDNAVRMLKLIEDMLKLSRMDSNIESEELTKFSLYDLCNEVCSEQLVTAQRKGITLKCFGNEQSTMFARKNMVKMLVSNLVNNAIKYNKENGSVDVILGENQDKIWVSIEDTGIGIPPKYQGRIFERFFMVEGGRTKDENMNTGLGLAIVKHIALVHSADIELESKENVGTKIKIIFRK